MYLTPTLLRRGLLAASLLLTGPTVFAQATTTTTTTKIKDKPGKGTTIKQKADDGQKTKLKIDDKLAADQLAADSKAGVMVGGAMMLPTRDIVDNAALSQDHTTLVAAVRQAELVETLKSAGPFTVFAPTNEAFNKLPPCTVDQLMLAESKDKLSRILTYHVVSGVLRAGDLQDGQTLTTVQGQKLTVMKSGGRTMLKDGTGKSVNITTPDVISSNGVTHVVDGILTPGM